MLGAVLPPALMISVNNLTSALCAGVTSCNSACACVGISAVWSAKPGHAQQEGSEATR